MLTVKSHMRTKVISQNGHGHCKDTKFEIFNPQNKGTHSLVLGSSYVLATLETHGTVRLWLVGSSAFAHMVHSHANLTPK